MRRIIHASFQAGYRAVWQRVCVVPSVLLSVLAAVRFCTCVLISILLSVVSDIRFDILYGVLSNKILSTFNVFCVHSIHSFRILPEN